MEKEQTKRKVVSHVQELSAYPIFKMYNIFFVIIFIGWNLKPSDTGLTSRYEKA
jgi:hypothetical protein